jgi:hypothetical protein
VTAAVTTATMETTAATCAAKAMESATGCTMNLWRSAESLRSAKWHAAPESGSVSVSAAAVKGRTSAVKSATAIVAMEPRTRADEGAAYKVARTVVSIRRAGVRIVSVVSVWADRRWSNISRPNANSHANRAYPDTNSDLRMGSASTDRNHEQSS